MSKVIGIDLGTTNSCVAVLEGKNYLIIPNSDGERTTPSVVNINEKNEIIVGRIAKNQAIMHPDSTISSIKTHMGEDYKVNIRGKEYTPQEISSYILLKLKKDAEDFLGEKVTDAIITVPAYFDEVQRQATKDAGEIAGLNVKRILNEPTAAAMAYGNENKFNGNIMVFDLGGGTFDVSILEISDSMLEVRATTGDNHLGGDDFDNKIVDWLIEEFNKENNMDLSSDKMAHQRLKDEAEAAKKRLSTKQETEISLPFITSNETGPKHLVKTITREKFEEISKDLLERLEKPVIQALEEAKLTKEDIDDIILVGGSTRIPIVQEIVRKFFGKEPSKSINPDESVAGGAAIQGGVVSGGLDFKLLSDVTPFSLGVGMIRDMYSILINKNTTIPYVAKDVYTTAYDYQTEVEFPIYQGENEIASQNKLLGELTLSQIEPDVAGVAQIEVSFELDQNGILNVIAKDLYTNKIAKTQIVNSLKLSKDKIDRLSREVSNKTIK